MSLDDDVNVITDPFVWTLPVAETLCEVYRDYGWAYPMSGDDLTKARHQGITLSDGRVVRL